MDNICCEFPATEKLGRDRSGALFMKMGARKIELAFKLIKSKLEEVDYVLWIARTLFCPLRNIKDILIKIPQG